MESSTSPQALGERHYLNTVPARSTFAMAIFLPFIATIAVIGRLYARHMKGVKLLSDDWLAIVALVDPPWYFTV